MAYEGVVRKILLILLLFEIMKADAQWVQVTTLPTRLNAVKFLDESTGFTAGNSGIWKTTNSGNNWTQMLPGFTLNSVCFIDNFNGYTVGYGRIFKTTDGGSNWSEYILGSGFTGTQAIGFFNINTGVSVGFQIINRTTNAGQSWYIQDSIYFQEQLAVSVLTNGYGYLAGGAPFELIKRTANYGVTWQTLGPFGMGGLNGVWTVTSDLAFVCGHFGRIRRTTNGGVNWTIQDSLTSRSLKAITFVDANTGTIVGDNGTIIHTTNSGINWAIQSSGTTNNLYGVSFINSNTGWAVGNNGIVLKTTNGGVTFVKILNVRIPGNFYLFQNYPNPFNPNTKIRFDLPQSNPLLSKEGVVSLKIFDILGSEIAVLVNESLKPGSYEAEWNASNYPSGIYYVRMTVGDYNQTRKMVLVK